MSSPSVFFKELGELMRIEIHVQTLPDLLSIGIPGMMKETYSKKRTEKETMSKYCSFFYVDIYLFLHKAHL